jgi:hypothetical protein
VVKVACLLNVMVCGILSGIERFESNADVTWAAFGQLITILTLVSKGAAFQRTGDMTGEF